MWRWSKRTQISEVPVCAYFFDTLEISILKYLTFAAYDETFSHAPYQENVEYFEVCLKLPQAVYHDRKK